MTDFSVFDEVPASSSASPVVPVRDAQLNIHGPARMVEEFRQLCKSERRTSADMLAILIQHFKSQ